MALSQLCDGSTVWLKVNKKRNRATPASFALRFLWRPSELSPYFLPAGSGEYIVYWIKTHLPLFVLSRFQCHSVKASLRAWWERSL